MFAYSENIAIFLHFFTGMWFNTSVFTLKKKLKYDRNMFPLSQQFTRRSSGDKLKFSLGRYLPGNTS